MWDLGASGDMEQVVCSNIMGFFDCLFLHFETNPELLEVFS